MTKNLIMALAAVSVIAMLSASPALAAATNPIAITNFTSGTGLTTNEAEVQQTWTALKALGTDSYLGGMIGNFKLDESSLIAGALSIGVTELDNFLKTGSLSISSSGLGAALSKAMTGAAGIDLSYLTGSFTSGGGSLDGLPFTTTASLSSSAGAASSAGQCDPSVASKQVAVGIQSVDNVVNSAMSDQYGFSQNSKLGGMTQNSGFAARGCLDKLFQNAGSDILFKPPSLGSLTQMLQGWACDKAVSVADQVKNQLGDLSNFNTTSMGGFYPSGVFGEANDGAGAVQPGEGNTLKDIFGDTFNEKNGTADAGLSSIASVFGKN
jgi:hypothetical protein